MSEQDKIQEVGVYASIICPICMAEMPLNILDVYLQYKCGNNHSFHISQDFWNVIDNIKFAIQYDKDDDRYYLYQYDNYSLMWEKFATLDSILDFKYWNEIMNGIIIFK